MAVKPFQKVFHDYQYDEDLVMLSPFPRSSLDKIKETEFDDKDIIIATYPKCGKFVIYLFLNLFEGCLGKLVK